MILRHFRYLCLMPSIHLICLSMPQCPGLTGCRRIRTSPPIMLPRLRGRSLRRHTTPIAKTPPNQIFLSSRVFLTITRSLCFLLRANSCTTSQHTTMPLRKIVRKTTPRPGTNRSERHVNVLSQRASDSRRPIRECVALRKLVRC